MPKRDKTQLDKTVQNKNINASIQHMLSFLVL